MMMTQAPTRGANGEVMNRACSASVNTKHAGFSVLSNYLNDEFIVEKKDIIE